MKKPIIDLESLFDAMNLPEEDRKRARYLSWMGKNDPDTATAVTRIMRRIDG